MCAFSFENGGGKQTTDAVRLPRAVTFDLYPNPTNGAQIIVGVGIGQSLIPAPGGKLRGGKK